MADAFIIMQIGNPELDAVCEKAIVPAIEACSLDPKRVDKHNQGGLLKSEIIGFIERADIIVADLTNERPNCYLEIGYTMGIDKFRNLILTAREDHYHESPNYKIEGPKIHFDLSGYDILFWHPERLDEFSHEIMALLSRLEPDYVAFEEHPALPAAYLDVPADGLEGILVDNRADLGAGLGRWAHDQRSGRFDQLRAEAVVDVGQDDGP